MLSLFAGRERRTSDLWPRTYRVERRHLLLRARFRQVQLVFSCWARLWTFLHRSVFRFGKCSTVFINCTLLGLRCSLFFVRCLAALFTKWALLSIELSWFGSLFQVEIGTQPSSAQMTRSVPIEWSRAVSHLVLGPSRERCHALYSYRYLIGTGYFWAKLPSLLSAVPCLKGNNDT